MQNELISAASDLFPTFEHWQSFLELSDLRNSIRDTWFIEATNKIRQHFINTLPREWDCEPWENTQRDTRWFLRKFGPDSPSVNYRWHYCLCLRLHNKQKFNTESIFRLLKKEGGYEPIYQAFDRIDRQFDGEIVMIESRNFKFGSANDGALSEDKLAWYARHEIDGFIEQAIAKIEKFTKNPVISDLLGQLNQTAQKESQTTC